MHEFSKQLMDPVVQSDILIAAILLDARGVIPGTTIKPVKRNDAPKETGKAPPERWQ